jgi:hypothetical protein
LPYDFDRSHAGVVYAQASEDSNEEENRGAGRVWSNGFGTSLWRDPITVWPLQ